MDLNLDDPSLTFPSLEKFIILLILNPSISSAFKQDQTDNVQSALNSIFRLVIARQELQLRHMKTL